MPRNPIEKCDVSFENRYGTTTSGNLPTHKTKDCVSTVVNIGAVQSEFPWVTIADFHFYHIKCPYSKESTVNYVRVTDREASNFWSMIEVPDGTQTYHTSTSGIMIRHSRGNKYGWMCVDPACKFYQLYNTNYFHI